MEIANYHSRSAQTEMKEISEGEVQETITVAPISVNIYRFPLAPAAQ